MDWHQHETQINYDKCLISVPHISGPKRYRVGVCKIFFSLAMEQHIFVGYEIKPIEGSSKK
jgi:hypothetical protein